MVRRGIRWEIRGGAEDDGALLLVLAIPPLAATGAGGAPDLLEPFCL